jgi:dethiobiotin synthetase
MTVLLVTGTDTGVGKTVVTAAIAAAAGAVGQRVAVLKPAQTGRSDTAPGEESDVDVVRRLAAPTLARTLAEYPDPLAPLVAARVSGRPALALDDVLAAIAELRAGHDLVLIEGAGGLLVPMGESWTCADLAMQLDGPIVVVIRAGLGTLNHTALTVEALSRRGMAALLVIGAWPARPGLVHRTNLEQLPAELAGVVPDGVGRWSGKRFRAVAPTWLGPQLYGTAPALAHHRDGVDDHSLSP